MSRCIVPLRDLTASYKWFTLAAKAKHTYTLNCSFSLPASSRPSPMHTHQIRIRESVKRFLGNRGGMRTGQVCWMSSDNKGAVDPAAETHFGFQTVRADEKATLVGPCRVLLFLPLHLYFSFLRFSLNYVVVVCDSRKLNRLCVSACVRVCVWGVGAV